MQEKITDYEIMAPVGSHESLQAAIQAGADSVYFGIGQLNMRAHSANAFTIDDLRFIAETCSRHNIKTYLTVNTIIYGEDIATMHTIVDAAHEAGITAVIASDVAVMTYCCSVGQEVHLSTQLNISNIEALRFYAQFADVVVLARELNMDQVAEIHRQIIEQQITGPGGQLVRIEMFCHGALCMAISGKCYMSLADAGRSANRGECIQICRRSYILTDAETGNQIEVDNKYLMSPKDLKTVRFIDRLMHSGVRVFKIEGRARGPEYVYQVVRCYKEAIQSVIDGTFATVRKQLVGKVMKFYSRLSVAEVAVEAAEISVGDQLLITGPTTGVMYIDATEIRYELQPVQTARQGWRVSIPVSGKVRPNDKLFKLIKTPQP